MLHVDGDCLIFHDNFHLRAAIREAVSETFRIVVESASLATTTRLLRAHRFTLVVVSDRFLGRLRTSIRFPECAGNCGYLLTLADESPEQCASKLARFASDSGQSKGGEHPCSDRLQRTGTQNSPAPTVVRPGVFDSTV